MISRLLLFVASLYCGSILLTPGKSLRAECFVVSKATTTRPFRHDVEVNGCFDERLRVIPLNGPSYFAMSSRDGETMLGNRTPSYCWYTIEDIPREAVHRVVVQDRWEPSDSLTLVIGQPAYLLTPAEVNPHPDVASRKLNHFVAYRVSNSMQVEREAALQAGSTSTELTPILYCVPVEEWHHARHYKIERPEQRMVVYGMSPLDGGRELQMEDQFGPRSLSLGERVWIAVMARELSAERLER